MTRPWIVVGNPENRRITGFLTALAEAGEVLAAVVPWRTVVADPDALLALPPGAAWLRLDSTGEDADVQRALYLLGGGDPAVHHAFGQLHAVSTHQRGFERVLDGVERVLALRPAWTPLAPIPRVRLVFDKARYHAHLRGLGVRVAPALDVHGYDALVAALAAWPGRRAFVKVRYGSSAVGIGVFSAAPAPRMLTTVEVTDHGWFNTLRPHRLTDVGRIRAIVDGLCEDGAHVELEVPKAGIDGTNFDLRVLMVANEPAFVVARCSRIPITNLHLGGWRGDVARVRAACPDEVWEAAMDDCRRVARDYGGLHVGLDVLLERGFTGHALIEANAFGDLLPNLTDAQGRSVYAREIASIDDWWRQSGEISRSSSPGASESA